MEEARGLTGMICCGRENEASMDRRGSVARYVASFEGCCSLPPMKTCSFRGCGGSGGTRAKTNGWAATVEESLFYLHAPRSFLDRSSSFPGFYVVRSLHKNFSFPLCL